MASAPLRIIQGHEPKPFQRRTWIRSARKALDAWVSRVEGTPHSGSDGDPTQGAGVQEGLADLGHMSRQGLILKQRLHQ